MPDSPVHPLGPPVVAGSEITVDTMLKQPTRVTRRISDLTLQKFLLDKVFTNAGSVSGGAVLYDQATANELYLKDDVEPIAAGGEYPIVGGERSVPKMAAVGKYGGRFFTFDESRDRNEAGLYNNKVTQLANTIVRKVNAIAMAELDALITAHSRTASTVSWADVITAGSSASSAELWPLKTFAQARAKNETDELGIEFDLPIMNPTDYSTLITIYGADDLKGMLAGLNFKEPFVTNRQTAGKVKFVAEGQVGEFRVEQPLQTVTYRADGEHTDRTWTKSSVKPVAYGTNPFAVMEYTGTQA